MSTQRHLPIRELSGRFSIFWHVTVPLVSPAMAVLAILSILAMRVFSPENLIRICNGRQGSGTNAISYCKSRGNAFAKAALSFKGRIPLNILF